TNDATPGPKTGEKKPPYFPSVFRPQFEAIAGPSGFTDVYITNYVLVEAASDVIRGGFPWRDLELGEQIIKPDFEGVYGVPFIVGARKGFPNFNEFAMFSRFEIVRRLEFRRVLGSVPIVETNQLVTVTVTNSFGIEAWNSYNSTSAYPRRIELIVGVRPSSQVTNSVRVYPLV